MKVPFNTPCITGKEFNYIKESLKNGHLCGDGPFTKRCEKWFEEKFGIERALLTTSCTHALEMIALLLDIKVGDEVIVPSYTFVSTANAFALHGAKIVFVDVDAHTLNLDLGAVEEAITNKTKAIVAVHYAGFSCDMERLMKIATKNNICVVEDAAQAVMSTYKGQNLGTIGHFGAYSFHETKNYTSAGEGGLLLINDHKFVKRAEIIREKGTNRAELYKGLVDKYTWIDIGSSYVLSDISAGYLLAQLESSDKINQRRLSIWKKYYTELKCLEDLNRINLPSIPTDISHNAHMFFVIMKDAQTRDKFIEYMKHCKVSTPFHYVPLHSSPAGKKLGYFSGYDNNTSNLSSRLLRLPLFYNLEDEQVDYVIKCVKEFFDG